MTAPSEGPRPAETPLTPFGEWLKQQRNEAQVAMDRWPNDHAHIEQRRPYFARLQAFAEVLEYLERPAEAPEAQARTPWAPGIGKLRAQLREIQAEVPKAQGADAAKFLTLLIGKCSPGTEDHDWRRCIRCLAMHELENRHSLARRFVQCAIDSLTRCRTREQQYRDLYDLPLCRQQLPDGVVPGNTEEALSGWHRAAHEFWKQRDVLKDQVRTLEQQVAQLLALLKDEVGVDRMTDLDIAGRLPGVSERH